MKIIRVIIVDDHEMVRQGLSALLMFEEDIEIIAEASNDIELFNYLDKNYIPDILLLDISLPGTSGIEIARKVTADLPEIKIIMLTALPTKSNIEESINIGVQGFILKNTGKETLVKAIRAVSGGDYFFDNSISQSVLKNILQSKKKRSDDDNEKKLTKRETEIIKLLAEGLPHKEIAVVTSISKRTVDTHVQNIMRKLSLHSKADIIKHAIKSRLIDL